ncbi:MAG: hypothetical protein FD137_360 [Spirochaetes bacterium]|nr:MAG: hypothetical protein FD137_360 [Spirochaetota bacterium]
MKPKEHGILPPRMNIEFHYYTLHYLAKAAGFAESEAASIAISSQLVDESIQAWEIGSKTSEITQNYVFWDRDVGNSIYRPFHFVPGVVEIAASRRKDGRPGAYVVTEDSPLAREILVAALKTKNPYRIGIALHAYADTWAHQNFSADDEGQNSMEGGDGPQVRGNRLSLPAVGHLHAYKNPDDPRLRWVDPRLKSPYDRVENTTRFLGAAKMIYRFLRTYRKESFQDEAFVVEPLGQLWSSPIRQEGSARAADYIIQFDVPPYESELWAEEAGGRPNPALPQVKDPFSSGYSSLTWMARLVGKAGSTLGARKGNIGPEGYEGSRFESWNKAAAAHRAFCRQLFAQRGIR